MKDEQPRMSFLDWVEFTMPALWVGMIINLMKLNLSEKDIKGGAGEQLYCESLYGGFNFQDHLKNLYWCKKRNKSKRSVA